MNGNFKLLSILILLGIVFVPQNTINSSAQNVFAKDNKLENTVTTTSLKILIDASRDGGVWWAPQATTYNSTQSHQGKALVDYFKGENYSVTELSANDGQISYSKLSYYDVVLCIDYGYYSQSELAAYKEYVSNGGNVFLLADHHYNGNIFQSFGLNFSGINVGGTIIKNFTPSVITQGVTNLTYQAGSGLVSYPSNATLLAWLPSNAFIDLNDNGVKDQGESYGSPVMGMMSVGSGKLLFLGDTNGIEMIPHPFTENYLNYFGKSSILYNLTNLTSTISMISSNSSNKLLLTSNSGIITETTPSWTIAIIALTLVILGKKRI